MVDHPSNNPLRREIQELRLMIGRMTINVDNLREQVDRVESAVAATGSRAQGPEPARPPHQIKVGDLVKILPRRSKNEPFHTAQYVGRVFTVTSARPVYIFFDVGSPGQPVIIRRQRQFVEAVNE